MPAPAFSPANPASLLPAGFAPALPLAVGYSGGADSTALLLACAARWPGQVQALHVHHGLQPAADGFADHCQAFCAVRGIPLALQRVQARPAAGESPENAARIARYEGFAAIVRTNPCGLAIKIIAIAQHADDQVETILLALSRGAGLPGLAAMPAHWERGGLQYCRPLLQRSARDIRQWLAAQGLRQGRDWVEDPTNADARYTRNRIRLQVMPALEAAFPHLRETFARSAAHAAQAQRLLAALAAEDLARLQPPEASGPQIKLLQALPRERQANALRHWVRSQCGFAPAAAQLEELLDQVEACTTRGHHIRIKVAAGFVERVGDSLAFAL